MSKTIAATFAALLTAVVMPVAAQPSKSSGDALRAMLKPYLEVHALLAQDKFAEIKEPAAALASEAAALGTEGADLAKAAAALSNANDLKGARDAFGQLSDALIQKVKADGTIDPAAELKVGYCPMIHKSWIQRGDQVRNPYYGAAMLTCGEVKPANSYAKPAK
jgi:hypothetical protein